MFTFCKARWARPEKNGKKITQLKWPKYQKPTDENVGWTKQNSKYLLRFNHLYKKKSWKREEFKNNCTLEENFIKMSSYLCLVWWQSKLLSSSLVLQWWLSEPFFLPVTLSFDKFLQLFCWFFLCTKKRKLFCVFA